ncbi:MAG: LytTR family transcriptional regulator [Flammeovirgaceae bacterium]|nr:LytTR family transcriptional regulator [Flammeovirgaceae bacterium]
MKYFTRVVQLFRKPFPDEENWNSYFRTLTILTLFITFFLYVFQPFGISTLESDLFLICLGFGSMTFAGAMVYELSVVQLLKLSGLKSNWTFGKWIVNMVGIMILSASSNFIFALPGFFGYIQWELFPDMMYSTFMIGIIPVTVLGAITMMTREKKFQKIAEEINQQKAARDDHTTTDITLFTIPIRQIRYIEALQNYVKIGHINADGWNVQTERATLKNILEEVKGSPMVKCHRSFLVNRNAIISTNGNAQGLLLTLSDCEKIIPVARSYVDSFRS